MTDIDIRPMVEADLPDILVIEKASFGLEAWTPGMFISELAATDSRSYWVATVPAVEHETHYFQASQAQEMAQPQGKSKPRNKSTIIGYVGLCTYVAPGDQSWIQTLAVAPEYRRQGIADQLLNHAMGVARHLGSTQMALEVASHNEGAQHLYINWGFAVVAVRPNYYPLTHDDALIMMVDLSGGAA